MVSAIGMARWKAAVPAATSTSKISSVAYATDDSASEEKIANAFVFVRRCCTCSAVRSGLPTMRLRQERAIATPMGLEETGGLQSATERHPRRHYQSRV